MNPEIYAHPEYQSFVASMRADESDAGRLICADWLEERGEEERARFIRGTTNLPNNLVQLHLKWDHATLLRCVADWFSTPLVTATMPILFRGVFHWRAGIASGIIRCGFLDTISSGIEFIFDNLDYLLAREPVRCVALALNVAQQRTSNTLIQWEGQTPEGNLKYCVAGQSVAVRTQWEGEYTSLEELLEARWPGVSFTSVTEDDQ